MGYNESTESGIVLICGFDSAGTEELRIGAGDVLVSKFFVSVIPFLPISMSCRIRKLRCRLFGALTERGTIRTLRGRNRLRVFVQRVIANDGFAMPVGRIELAVAG